ncbi:MAG: serine hydrolase, partial [Bacteroidota bacterium]
KVQYLSQSGVRANDTKDLIGVNTIFGAASLSKPVFAYAVLQLEKQGKIDLDKPVYQYLENADLADDPRYKQITTRMLLSHSSGLPNWRNGALKLLHDPGSKFQYSGEGYMYLAKVVEQIMRKPINELMQILVFEPLGMENSSYIWENRFETDFASPHDYTGTPKPNWRPETPVVASSLHTTAADYSKFMIALLKGEGLDSQTYQQIKSPQIQIHDSLAWGLGWGIQQSARGDYLWQWGDNGNTKAFTMFYPNEQKGMVFFVNSYKGLRMLPELVDHLFKDKIPEFNMLERSRRVRADEKLLLAILEKGIDKGIQGFLASNKQSLDTNLITEGQADFVAMQLRWRNQNAEEGVLLKLITHTFPNSFKALKSYAAHCIKHGHQKEGIEYYKKALALVPQDKDVSNTLHLLTAKELKGNVTFVFQDYLWASSVSVQGSFNDWSSSSIPMLKKNGVWTTTITLPPGQYLYQFVVNGYPMLDPKNEVTVREDWRTASLLKVD